MAFWKGMSNKRKCELCASLGDPNKEGTTCFTINKEIREKEEAEKAAKAAHIASLKEQMNLHVSQAKKFGAEMQPDRQADSMASARNLAKEISHYTSEPYADPFGQGQAAPTVVESQSNSNNIVQSGGAGSDSDSGDSGSATGSDSGEYGGENFSVSSLQSGGTVEMLRKQIRAMGATPCA